QARRALALAYLHLGEPALAVETLERGAEYLTTPDAKKQHELTVLNVHTEARAYDKAIALAQGLTEKYPDEFDMHAVLISTLLAAGKNDEATEKLNTVIRKFAVSEPTRTQRLRAEVYRETGDYDRAAGVLTPLVKEAEEPADILFELALTYGAKKDVAKAEHYYEQVIRHATDEDSPGTDTGTLVNAYNNLAYLYAQENVKIDKAEEYANKAL